MQNRLLSVQILGCLFLLLTSICGSSIQERLQDHTSQQATEQKVEALLQRSSQLLDNQKAEEARELLFEALQIARDSEDQKLLAWTLENLAWSYELAGNFSVALKTYHNAEAIHRETQNKKALSNILNAMGNCAGQLDNYKESIAYYSEALTLFEELDNVEGIAYILNNMAVIYEDMGNTEKEIEYYSKAFEFSEEHEFVFGAALAKANLGATNVRIGTIQEGEKLLQEALEKNKTTNRSELDGYIYLQMALAAKARSSIREALDFNSKALKIARDNSNGNDVLNALMLRSELLPLLGKTDEALQANQEAIELIEKLNLPSRKIQALAIQSEIFEKEGNYRRALSILQEHNTLKEEQENQQTKRTIHEMQARFDLDRKEHEIALLNSEKEVKELQLHQQEEAQKFLIITLVLLLAGVTIVFYFFRLSVRARKEVTAKNTALAQAYKKMEDLAKEDTLTGLANRRAFQEMMIHERNRQERTKEPMCFILADIDHFKQINDSFGHDLGDEVLIWLSDILRSQIRKQDLVCRWGGEEFLLLLPETGLEGGVELAERVRNHLKNNKYTYKDADFHVSLTIGVAECRKEDDPKSIIHFADLALYQGKSQGRDQIVPYSGESRFPEPG